MKLSKEVKQHLLGEMGVALIQQLLYGQDIRSYPSWDVFHRSCDLLIEDKSAVHFERLKTQIKCKVPWAVESSQSFTVDQWEEYKTADRIYFICAPIQGRFETNDIWKGHIYSGVPSELVTRQKQTRSGRDMTLVPLDQPNLKLEFTIKNKKCLDLMRELTTQDQ